MKKQCIVCESQDEIELKVIVYNIKDKWWMCMKCIQNQNGEWDKAKENYYELQAKLP